MAAQVQRMSRLMVKTLRDDPADAETLSHKLLVRAGYVRRNAAGIWSWLPLGKKVLENVTRVVREEMDAIGAQEVLLPALLPKEPYEATGRWEEYGAELFRLKDRKGADYLLGPTHEEIFTQLGQGPVHVLQGPAGDPLPDPDEVPRRGAPAFGHPARPRVPDEGLVLLRHHRRGPGRVVRAAPRGVHQDLRAARASTTASCSAVSGAMGGSASEEFLAPAAAGEDTFVDCPSATTPPTPRP